MKPIALLVVPLLFAGHSASAATVDGNGALAVAALVAKYSPLLRPAEKIVLAHFLDGRSKVIFPPDKKITVAVDAFSCRVSNVDITLHACDLTFGKKKVAVQGRSAHELYATLVEIGVPPDGAAGTIFESLSNLDCVIDPGEVEQKAGGGAHCKYDPPK